MNQNLMYQMRSERVMLARKSDGKETEKRKPDEEVGKGNVVEKQMMK